MTCAEMPKGRCLAGFSGGADSTALMILLTQARDEGQTLPEAIHVNHGLRGDESDGDEQYCREFCAERGITLHVIRPQLHGRSDENACREARFQCFRETMKATGIRQLVLAHNRDDLTETFMMRLIRGTGAEGLACMNRMDRQDDFLICRPLLNIGRKEIRDYLLEAGIAWREDSSNRDNAYFRNRIRNQLIPLMEEMCGGAARRIARTAMILSEENEILSRSAAEYVEQYGACRFLDTKPLTELPQAMRRRILREWWKENTTELQEHALNSRQTEEITDLSLSERGKMNLPGGLYAVKTRHGLYMTGFREKTPEPVPYQEGEIRFGDVKLITAESEGNPGNGILEQEIPAGFLKGCVIRTRKPGDRIRPFGMSGSRKLQDYLTDKGIDEPLRDRIPLLCRGQEVLLAAGVGAGGLPEWQREAENVRLKWQGVFPWCMKTERE